MNFGGIEREFSTWTGARFVVLPVPYDLTSTYQSGSRRGPAAILDASRNMELYDEELSGEIYRAGIHTLPAIEADARGPEQMTRRIRQGCRKIIKAGKIPVVLGGEHTVTVGAVQAVMEKWPSLTVLQLDAHADMRSAYQGSPFSHACVARRIEEMCPIVQVGIRSMCAEEASHLRDRKTPLFSADRIHEDPREWEKILYHLQGDVYVTVDLDVFDPSIMPSTGTPEPGGLTWRQVMNLLRQVSLRCTVRGFDVVELSPIPGIVAPDFLAARLIYRFMGYLTP